MAKKLSDHLLNSLEELVPYDFEKFKFKLQNTSLEKEHPRIPRGLLQMARPVKLATLLVNNYGEEDAVRLTLQVLRGINQRLLAEELYKATGQDYPTQDGGTDSSAVLCSSGENKPKSLKIPDGPDGDRQQQSGEGIASLQSGQPEAERGFQKKSQDRRRDQGPDGQGKPAVRSMTPPARRGPFLSPARLAGEKGCILSSRLRRNAHSTSRLQGLSSNSFCGSLVRREPKRAEGKKRPKSLELAISSEKGEPLNPEILLTLEEIKIVSPDTVGTPGKMAIPDIEATVAPEKGSRNPEQSVIQEGGTFRNVLTSVSLTGEEKTQEHPESTTPLEENRIGSAEAPEMLHEPSNPKAPPFLGKKGHQNPGHLASLGMVACKGRPWEGESAGGTCVHGSSSCSGGHGALDGRLSSCPRCQTPLPKEQLLHSLSPEPPPPCERHMKQPRLLFCEDHRELVCLICSLSQEHRGHQVRPIEEVALEFKEQIHWQLEHLKELRKSGEEQKYQGDKETANFLKQTEAQKQKVRHQMQQLCQFLEKQEQLFVAWLEELGQTIGQVREKYGSRVSQDIALLDELIGELEAKQCQPAWGLVQDIEVTLHRAKTVTIPEPWATPPEVKEKIHLFYHKSEFVEKSMKRFSESLRSEVEMLTVPAVTAAQAHAVKCQIKVSGLGLLGPCALPHQVPEEWSSPCFLEVGRTCGDAAHGPPAGYCDFLCS
ncbi:pyrin isoform 1-T1 [Trichechus inunguis]